MATVTITLEDGAEVGEIKITMQSEPGWPGPACKDGPGMTNAQVAGLSLMEWAAKNLGEQKPGTATVGGITESGEEVSISNEAEGDSNGD